MQNNLFLYILGICWILILKAQNDFLKILTAAIYYNLTCGYKKSEDQPTATMS